MAWKVMFGLHYIIVIRYFSEMLYDENLLRAARPRTKQSTIMAYALATIAGAGVATLAAYGMMQEVIQHNIKVEKAQVACAERVFGKEAKPEMMGENRFFLNNAWLGLSNVSGSYNLSNNQASTVRPYDPNATTVLRMLSACKADKLKAG